MAEDITYAYIPFSGKSDDSQRIVEGYVSSPAVDCDEQIVDQGWLRSELPSWLARWGNIRAQHDPQRAVGKAQSVDLEAQPGPYLAARIVDDDAWKKVKAGVYNGFSVGIKAPRIVSDPAARNGRIVGGTLIEVSVVDRPANDSAKFVVLKRAGANQWKLGEGGPVLEDLGRPAQEPAVEVSAPGKGRESEVDDTVPGSDATAGDAPAGGTPLDGESEKAAGAGAPAPAVGERPGQPTRPPALRGELEAFLAEVRARLEALADQTTIDRNGDIDTAGAVGNAKREAPNFQSERPNPDRTLVQPESLFLGFASRAELEKFVDRRIGALSERAHEQFLTKAAAAEPLATIPDIAKLASGLAKGLEALAERAEAGAEALAAVKAAMGSSQEDVARLGASVAEVQTDLAKVKELAQPVKGAVFALDKGLGLEPDRLSADGTGKAVGNGAWLAGKLEGLSEEQKAELARYAYKTFRSRGPVG